MRMEINIILKEKKETLASTSRRNAYYFQFDSVASCVPTEYTV